MPVLLFAVGPARKRKTGSGKVRSFASESCSGISAASILGYSPRASGPRAVNFAGETILGQSNPTNLLQASELRESVVHPQVRFDFTRSHGYTLRPDVRVPHLRRSITGNPWHSSAQLKSTKFRRAKFAKSPLAGSPSPSRTSRVSYLQSVVYVCITVGRWVMVSLTARW